MTRRTRLGLIFFLLFFILAGGAGMYYYQTHYIRAEFHGFPLPEATGNLNRPECGWYQLYGYTLQPDTHIGEDKLYVTISDGKGYSYRLALLEFNLSAYADKDLDASAKANIEQVFQTFASTKMKLIIRFLYDWDGNGQKNEPEKISFIKRHMEQAGEILNEYKDQIYTTQGIFIGSWAEMHGSKFMSAEDMTSLILTFAKNTDPSIFLSVRTPAHYHTIFQQLEEYPEKYAEYQITSEELKKRLGLFNDGLFGSYSDLGTYQSVDAVSSDFEKFGKRQKELSFQEELCQKVPNGGEAVGGNELSSGASAVADLAKMHISYLNHIYDLKVIDRWKEETITETGNVYDGKTYYEYITDHMGARFVLSDCEVSYRSFQSGNATGILAITNTGFSNLYTEKDFSLRLIHNETKKETVILDSKDFSDDLKTNHWLAGAETKIPFSFSPFDFEDGEYDLVAMLTDPDTDDEIPFANHCEHAETGGYVLGTLTITRPKLQTKTIGNAEE